MFDEISSTVVDGGQEFVIKVKCKFILDKSDCLFFAWTSVSFMEALKDILNKGFIRNRKLEAGC